MDWIMKYKPKKSKDIVGQEIVVKTVENWLDRWKVGQSLLLYGPSGIGKNIIVETIALERKLLLTEINASESRTSESIKKILDPVTKQDSLLGNGRIILIDEIDSLSRDDYGGLSEITNAIKESRFPIILTANNIYIQKLRPLRGACEYVRLRRIHPRAIEKKLREICRSEGIEIDFKSLTEIAKNCNGDLRSAITDLETFCRNRKGSMEVVGSREREENIFDVMKTVFRGNMKDAIVSINSSDKEIDEIFWWVEENVCNEFEGEEIIKAFNVLSNVDMFRSKIIKNQNYRFRKYMVDLMASISSLKRRKHGEFSFYKPPTRIMTLGQTKEKRAKDKEIQDSLAKSMHCSRRNIKNQLPYLKIIQKSLKGM